GGYGARGSETPASITSILSFYKGTMVGVDINTLTMEINTCNVREKPEIRGNVNFEIKSQFMRELKEGPFSGNKNEDAHDHVDRVLNIVSLFNIPGVSQNAILLRVFPFTLTGSAKRWVDRLTSGAVNTWDLLKKPLSKVIKPHLDKECPLNEEVKQVDEVKYSEFGHPTPFNGSIGAKFRVGPPGYYTCTDNQTSYREKKPNLVKMINNYMEEATKRQAEQDKWLKTFFQNTKNSRIDHGKIIQKLESQVKTLAAKVETKVAQFEECKMIFANDGTPLYTPFYYSPEEM
ncbi:hypothetical protein Tco_0801302, partial [Tanacetum coccineum]